MPQIEEGTLIRALLTSGYLIDLMEHPTSDCYVMLLRKRDLLGAEARLLLVVTKTLPTGLWKRLTKVSEHTQSTPIIVSDGDGASIPEGICHLSLNEFFDLLGGAMLTDRIFDASLPSIMDQLAHNALPPGFHGKPEDLLEMYSKDCLQFLFECPVSQYGQERRFERLPDGFALGRHQFNVYFDAKAYSSEFLPSGDDLRRFSDYVGDFNQRYEKYVGPVSVLLLISGSFSSDLAAIQNKTNGFLAETSTPMCLMRATDLARSIARVRSISQHRGAINWKRILAAGIYDTKSLEAELDRIAKDKVIN